MSSNSKNFVALVKEAKQAVDDAEKTLEKKRELLEKLQENCVHDWQYDGHGHNDDFYVCTVCGAEESR